MMASHTTGASARHQNNDRAWRDGVQTINDEAAGLLDVSIVDALSGAELIVDAMLGNHEAAALLLAVRQAAERVRQAPRRKPALCIACPRSVKHITADTVFGIAVPATPNPTGAIGFVFCAKCAADRGTLSAKAADGLRRIWPTLRQVEITHPAGGRA
jgi:hypothetical protein